MRRIIQTFFVAVFGVFFCALHAAPQPAQDTEKLKILSACRINGEWIFNLYDGVEGKTVSLKMGKTHGLGYRVLSFDEGAQTASVQTPYGVFSVAMNAPNPAAAVSSAPAESSPSSAAAQNAEDASSGVVSRGRILRAIK